MRGTVVLFPVDALSNDFSSLTYTVPMGITNHYIAGLIPLSSYTVTQNSAGSMQQVTIAPGTGLTADGAGLLFFNNASQTLSSAPRFVSAVWRGSNVQLAGTGMANLTYRILSNTNLASTTWIDIGSATANNNGNFQFIDASTSSNPQRFYRAAWP